MGKDMEYVQVESDDKAQSDCQPPLWRGCEYPLHLRGLVDSMRVRQSQGIFPVCDFTSLGMIFAEGAMQVRWIRCERDGTLIFQMSREV